MGLMVGQWWFSDGLIMGQLWVKGGLNKGSVVGQWLDYFLHNILFYKLAGLLSEESCIFNWH